MARYQSFYEFLWQRAEKRGVMDGMPKDRAIEAFEAWQNEIEVAEVLEWADIYGELCFKEGEIAGIKRGGEVALDALKLT